MQLFLLRFQGQKSNQVKKPLPSIRRIAGCRRMDCAGVGASTAIDLHLCAEEICQSLHYRISGPRKQHTIRGAHDILNHITCNHQQNRCTE